MTWFTADQAAQVGGTGYMALGSTVGSSRMDGAVGVLVRKRGSTVGKTVGGRVGRPGVDRVEDGSLIVQFIEYFLIDVVSENEKANVSVLVSGDLVWDFHKDYTMNALGS
jgi:hypothetical protein